MLQKKIHFFSLFLVSISITHQIMSDEESYKNVMIQYEQKIKGQREEIEALKKYINPHFNNDQAFGFMWKQCGTLLPDNSWTQKIPTRLWISSYSYPEQYYGNTKQTLQYLSFATTFSIALELREMRREMMKRGEYWDPKKIWHATRSSIFRRTLTMGAAFPMFVYCCTEVNKMCYGAKSETDN